MSGSLHSTIQDGVCTLTIENSGKRNALSPSILKSITETVNDLEERESAQVLVLTGEGEKAFSSGFDISEFEGESNESKRSVFTEAVTSIYEYQYPTLAMINGDTYGGAMELIAVCDLRIAVNEASFAVTPAKLGLIYGDRGINQIMHHIGPANTQELLFTAKPIDSDRAADMGFLNHVVNRSELEDKTYGLAEEINRNAPKSLRGMKQIVRALLNKRALSDTEKEFVHQLRKQAQESEDHQEGIQAFSEGRVPEFSDK